MAPLALTSLVSAEWIPAEYATLLFLGLVLAGIGTFSLFCIGLVAYTRRRSTRYLLVTLALGALASRTVVGWGTAYGVVPMPVHHILEHGLDFLVAAIILYAVYRTGRVRPANASSQRGD